MSHDVHGSDPRLKYLRATIFMRMTREVRIPEDPEDLLKSSGCQGSDDYWDNMLPEDMSAGAFMDLLYSNLIDPHRLNHDRAHPNMSLKSEIEWVLRIAYKNRAPFLVSPQEDIPFGEDVRLRPRGIANRLMLQPWMRQYVPHSLQEYLSRQPTDGAPANGTGPEETELISPRRKGPVPKKLNGVKEKMRRLGRDVVAPMSIKQMVASFPAGKTTCIKARDQVFPRPQLNSCRTAENGN
jgi:hypothetical protein